MFHSKGSRPFVCKILTSTGGQTPPGRLALRGLSQSRAQTALPTANPNRRPPSPRRRTASGSSALSPPPPRRTRNQRLPQSSVPGRRPPAATGAASAPASRFQTLRPDVPGLAGGCTAWKEASVGFPGRLQRPRHRPGRGPPQRSRPGLLGVCVCVWTGPLSCGRGEAHTYG
uniref:Uncharacterized protein n=1 Tax=Pipistrellus kuhlii TaxID=59472 RepID=A0A7J7Y912_PIPKU|nr:hypothetical protein mPipKuh1_010250 [Pipistrellus kuhlii]